MCLLARSIFSLEELNSCLAAILVTPINEDVDHHSITREFFNRNNSLAVTATCQNFAILWVSPKADQNFINITDNRNSGEGENGRVRLS